MQKLHYHLRRRSHELVDALYANSGLHIRGDYHGIMALGEPQDVEQGQGGEGLLDVDDVVLVREDIHI